MENKIKFKVIKEYPGSSKIDTEYTPYNKDSEYFFRKYPEYYEEIKEEKTFITYDGVKLKEKDYVYIYHMNLAYPGRINNIDDFIKYYSDNKTYLIFHSKLKLNEHVINNTPCLSVNDIINYLKEHKYFVSETTKQQLISLAKSKPNK